jgi:hypothetical protein
MRVIDTNRVITAGDNSDKWQNIAVHRQITLSDFSVMLDILQRGILKTSTTLV